MSALLDGMAPAEALSLMNHGPGTFPLGSRPQAAPSCVKGLSPGVVETVSFPRLRCSFWVLKPGARHLLIKSVAISLKKKKKKESSSSSSSLLETRPESQQAFAFAPGFRSKDQQRDRGPGGNGASPPLKEDQAQPLRPFKGRSGTLH